MNLVIDHEPGEDFKAVGVYVALVVTISMAAIIAVLHRMDLLIYLSAMLQLA